MKITHFLMLFLFLVSCKEAQQKQEISSDGIWQQLGYGKIIQIENDSIKIYDICKVGCQVYDKLPLAEKGKIDFYSKDSLTIRKNLKTYKYSRLKELPISCREPVENPKDPVYNFEVLWHTFNEHYCYFGERKIDWNAVYQKYKPSVTKETTELELYQIFDEILTSLEDGHVGIEMPESLSAAIKSIEKSKKLDASKKEPTVNKQALELKTRAAIPAFYCKELKSHNAGWATWGMMKDDIAYVQINAMLFLAFYDIPTELSMKEWWPLYQSIAEKRTFQRQDEIDGSAQLMEIILKDLSHAKAYVVDLRFNIGGKDEVGLEIIGHFVNQKLLVAQKKAKLKDRFTNHQQIYLEPKTPNFLGAVYVLTSHETASAAELASMSTQLPANIIRIGSNTEGIFSDQLEKRLPIGWEYILSNEIYEDHKGRNYEGIGVPPDISLAYPKGSIAFYNLLLGQLATNGDEAIEKVFQLQQEKKHVNDN